MPAAVSGIVLAGGQSRRLGRDKASEPLGGAPLLTHVIRPLSQVAGEIIVVAANQAHADSIPLPRFADVTVDAYPGAGALGGIFTGLTAASNPWALVVACDMPFLNTGLLRWLASLAAAGDAVVPVVNAMPEPAHALYNKSCLPVIEQRLQSGALKAADVLGDLAVRYVPEDELRRHDPNLLSFFNINTPDDLERAKALIEKGAV